MTAPERACFLFDGILNAVVPFRKGDGRLYTALVVGPERHSGVWLRRARVCALFVGLTAVMTWPSVLHLATHSVDHQDIFFNLWRMEWVRHALLTSPRDLFNGNQFYPERGVLAYSDAMMVESLIALPLLSAGLPPMLVHNLLLLGVIAASGIGMFVLARLSVGQHARGDRRRPDLRLRALPVLALHAHGAAVGRVDAVGLLGACSGRSTPARCATAC